MAWIMDIQADALKHLRFMSATEHGWSEVIVYEGKYAVKFCPSSRAAEHELRMMLLAGDCSVKPIGRVLHNGVVEGFVMPLETTIDVRRLDASSRMRIIKELPDLLNRLHEKGIIHGDINVNNLLLCADGKLRFCDLGLSIVVSAKYRPPAGTTRFQPAYTLLVERHHLSTTEGPAKFQYPPWKKYDDYYATALTMWHLYTGQLPFQNVDEDEIEDAIISGLLPDLNLKLIDDRHIHDQIHAYMATVPAVSRK